MKNIFLLLFLFTSVSSLSQELSCFDFKEGSFYSPSDKAYDKVVLIKRSRNTQTETVKTEAGIKKIYAKITWIDDCTYRLVYDDSKMKLDEIEMKVNSYNGIVVRHLDFEKNCVNYEATLTKTNGQQVIHTGKICLQ